MSHKGFSRLVLDGWAHAAKEIRALSSGAVLIEALGVRFDDGATAFFRRLDALSVPSVAVLGGACDASALALLASVTLGFVREDIEITADADAVLALGLTSVLPAALGGAPARALLLGGPVDAASLCQSGLATRGDPAEAADRLADPAAALLVRSLRVAARSTREQSRQYDDELRQLLLP